MALELRSLNFKSMKVTASANYTAGDMLKINDVVGLIVEDTAQNNEAVLIYAVEKVVVPKMTGVSFSAGSKVYYNASEKKVTSDPTDNTLCGVALESASNDDTSVLIDLDGMPKS